MPEGSVEARLRSERVYVYAMAIGLAVVVLLPYLYAVLTAPAGSQYLGFQFASDDHMVYSAWMRQAMSGHFFFDNRFAVDSQPGLTVHLYFLALGWIAKLVGIPLASNLARAILSGLFVLCLYRLVRRFSSDAYTTKLILGLVVIGGGIGFLVWHNFGEALVRPESQWMASLTGGGQPIDIWQPEAFLFSSALTNGLFMASLCLLLTVFNSVLDAKQSWRAVVPGFLCFGLLMNIHSYDVLIVLAALTGLLATQLVKRDIAWDWVVRTFVIALGALPAALWFMHVLKEDTVFQARAATETYTSNIRMVFMGYLPLLVLGVVALFRIDVGAERAKWARMAALAFCILVIGMVAAAPPAGFLGYFMAPGVWVLVALIALASSAFLATDNPAKNLVISWALLGWILPYFPALYQRKLMMGLSIPWAILAALAIAALVVDRDRSKRNLATVLSLIVLGGTSLRWFFREIDFIKGNVTRTATQPVFLTSDVQEILDYLNRLPGERTVVLGVPGSWAPAIDAAGQRIPDQFSTPALPDLNSILSGFAGVYSFAGHWSETPFMDKPDPNAPMQMSRRQMASAVFSPRTPPEVRRAILEYVKPDYLLAPSVEAYGDTFYNAAELGDIVAGKNQFVLIKFRR